MILASRFVRADVDVLISLLEAEEGEATRARPLSSSLSGSLALTRASLPRRISSPVLVIARSSSAVTAAESGGHPILIHSSNPESFLTIAPPPCLCRWQPAVAIASCGLEVMWIRW